MMDFKLTEKESIDAIIFEDDHRHSDVYRGAIGGGVTYSFGNTSLGRMCTVRCALCDKTELLDAGQF